MTSIHNELLIDQQSKSKLQLISKILKKHNTNLLLDTKPSTILLLFNTKPLLTNFASYLLQFNIVNEKPINVAINDLALYAKNSLNIPQCENSCGFKR